MRSFTELAAVDVAKEAFFDETGGPNGNYWRFVNDCSLFTYSQPDANGANADVMAAVGQYTDAQQQHISDYANGTGQYASQGQQWFQNTTTLASVAGLGGNASVFGTTITALRVNITVHDGQSQYRLSAVVSPQGGATMNTTQATNAANAATGSAATATTQLSSTAQPSSTATTAATATAASQSINYPFTLLELLEDDDIPLPPPPPLPPA
jgi:general secretion pathway protein K